MKAGVCLQLSNTSDRDAWRRRGLIEANLLQITTPARSCTYRANLTDHDPGAVVYLSSHEPYRYLTDRDAWRRRGLIEAIP